MREILVAISMLAGAAGTAAAMKPGQCTFANVARVRTHASEHVKYPAKGAIVKEACKKEWPDELSKAEWACFDASLQDGRVYRTPAEVLEAVGVKP